MQLKEQAPSTSYESYCYMTMSLLELIQEGQEVLGGLLHNLTISVSLLTRHTHRRSPGPTG